MDTMKAASEARARAMHFARAQQNDRWPQHTVTGRFEPLSSAEARMGAEHRWWLDQQMQSLTRKLTRDGVA